MRRISIDTNIYAAFKRGNASVVEALKNCDMIGLDITVLAELFSGFALGNKEKKNRAELSQFLNTPRVSLLEHDAETADYYAAIFKQLRKKGRSIPTNDLWIAANALRNGLAVYSLDKHFSLIDGLPLHENY